MRQGLVWGWAAQARFGVWGEFGRRNLIWWEEVLWGQRKVGGSSIEGLDWIQQKMRDFRPKGLVTEGWWWGVDGEKHLLWGFLCIRWWLMKRGCSFSVDNLSVIRKPNSEALTGLDLPDLFHPTFLFLNNTFWPSRTFHIKVFISKSNTTKTMSQSLGAPSHLPPSL